MEWSTPGVDVSVAEYSDMISYTFGASDGTFGTLIGVVCHEPVILKNLNWLLLNTDSTINVVVLALDADGKLTNKELYVDGDAPNVSYDMTYYTFSEDVYAPNGCFIGLSTDEGFLDIATAINTPDKPFVPQYNAYIEDYLVEAAFEYVESLGSDYCENFFLGYAGLSLADDEAPVITYNVYREDEAAMSVVANTGVKALSYIDDEWAVIPQGDYKYAITAVYRNGAESQPVYTPVITRDDSGVEGLFAEDLNITLNGTVLNINMVADEVYLYSADGVQVAYAASTSTVAVDNCSAGVYMVRVLIDGKWYVEKELIK